MIIYNPLDGLPLSQNVQIQARHCFLMTRLGDPVPPMVQDMRNAVEQCCGNHRYTVIDAQARVTGRDFLLKIWKLIASAPLSVGVVHEDIPENTQANIFYEIGVAQAMGKETVIIKSLKSKVPSDFVRTEYIKFDDQFEGNFNQYFASVFEQADYYELMADQLERNPVLALDYLKRAFLITSNDHLKNKARQIVENAGLDQRAANSVEILAASF